MFTASRLCLPAALAQCLEHAARGHPGNSRTLPQKKPHKHWIKNWGLGTRLLILLSTDRLSFQTRH